MQPQTWLAVALLLVGAQAAAGASLWPQPQHQAATDRVLYLHPRHFQFRITGRSSDALAAALDRYEELMRETPSYVPQTVAQLQQLNVVSGAVYNLSVHVRFSDQSLNLGSDESYTLRVDAPESRLVAPTVWGALRGLETFSQLVDRVDVPPGVEIPAALAAAADDGSDSQGWLPGPLGPLLAGLGRKHGHGRKRHHGRHHGKHKHGGGRGYKKHHEASFWVINATYIKDAPRFQHRGLLIDTARHFLPVPIIKAHLDAMAWVKLNVLHWHMTDDQSFPFESAEVPALAREGAFAPGAVYTAADVQDVVSYAHARGVRVIPEFDTPGHVRSWGRGEPQMLVPCGDDVASDGLLDPTRKHTYTVLWRLLRDVSARFPDSYVHLGGDEVPLGCWERDAGIRSWMRDHNVSSVTALEQLYIRSLLRLATDANRSYIVWQEVLDSGVAISNDTIVQVWKWWPVDHANGDAGVARRRDRLKADPRCRLSRGCRLEGDKPPAFLSELERVTKAGFRSLLSSPWYLNLGQNGVENWATYHAVEPLSFQGSDAQKQLVVGGEAAMWGEFADATNALPKTWPDAAAVAERLWSPAAADQPQQTTAAARPRLVEHRCRMLARGGTASPLGPGFCPTEAPAAADSDRCALPLTGPRGSDAAVSRV